MATSELSSVRSESLASCCGDSAYLPGTVHYLDNALLGVHGLDKLWLGGVWLVYSACNIKGPLGAML